MLVKRNEVGAACFRNFDDGIENWYTLNIHIISVFQYLLSLSSMAYLGFRIGVGTELRAYLRVKLQPVLFYVYLLSHTNAIAVMFQESGINRARKERRKR